MGAWGTGIFSDDLACDVRDNFVKQIILGKSAEEATHIVKSEFLENDVLTDEVPVFWISLALTQWKKGRLLPEVRDMAIQQIDNGGDLLNWEDSAKKVIEKRKIALTQARETLLSPMPPAKKIPMPTWMKDDPWQTGDILSYRIIKKDIPHPEYCDMFIILRVVEMWRFQKGGSLKALFGVYNWSGDEIPDLTVLKNLEFMKLTEVNQGVPEYKYFTHEHIIMDKRDVKEREIKLLKSEPGFDKKDDPILNSGHALGGFGGPLAFDVYVSKLLHKYNNK